MVTRLFCLMMFDESPPLHSPLVETSDVRLLCIPRVTIEAALQRHPGKAFQQVSQIPDCLIVGVHRDGACQAFGLHVRRTNAQSRGIVHCLLHRRFRRRNLGMNGFRAFLRTIISVVSCRIHQTGCRFLFTQNTHTHTCMRACMHARQNTASKHNSKQGSTNLHAYVKYSRMHTRAHVDATCDNVDAYKHTHADTDIDTQQSDNQLNTHIAAPFTRPGATSIGAVSATAKPSSAGIERVCGSGMLVRQTIPLHKVVGSCLQDGGVGCFSPAGQVEDLSDDQT